MLYPACPIHGRPWGARLGSGRRGGGTTAGLRAGGEGGGGGGTQSVRSRCRGAELGSMGSLGSQPQSLALALQGGLSVWPVLADSGDIYDRSKIGQLIKSTALIPGIELGRIVS